MPIYSQNQQDLAEKISPLTASLPKWKDWQWQLKQAIHDIDGVENLLGIRLEEAERASVALTLKKFPLAITPYYLSLIDAKDFRIKSKSCCKFRLA